MGEARSIGTAHEALDHASGRHVALTRWHMRTRVLGEVDRSFQLLNGDPLGEVVGGVVLIAHVLQPHFAIVSCG